AVQQIRCCRLPTTDYGFALRLLSMRWQIEVSENQKPVFSGESDSPVELGRQADRAEAPYSLKRIDDHWRVIVAPLEEHNVSRRHALLEAEAENYVRLTNLSTQQPVRLVDSADLLPHDSCVAPLPVVLTLGTKTIRIQAMNAEVPLRSLEEAAPAPGRASVTQATMASPAGGQVGLESLIRGLQGVLDVLHSATTSSDFLVQAARAVVDLVRLDSCRVLMLEGEEWKTQAAHTAPQVLSEKSWQPSRQILNQLRQEKKRTWQAPELAAVS